MHSASPSAATASPASQSVTPSPSATSAGANQITLSGQGAHLPSGPFKITPVYCGTFTQAQRNTFGTNARGGLIYRYTNESNTLTAAANLSVNFLKGSMVVASNVAGAGNLPSIDPGQSAEGEVDAVGGSGGNIAFSGCEVMDYGLITDSSGALPGTYAP